MNLPYLNDPRQMSSFDAYAAVDERTPRVTIANADLNLIFDS